MAGSADQVKGRAEEIVGDVTGDKDLSSTGTADRRTGKAKEKVGKVEGKVEEKVDEVIETVAHVLHPK